MQECVISIQQQTFTNYEVWIIDGNSSDRTKEFLEKLSTPFYSVSEKDNGIYDAMNKGVSLSKGEWLYFLGADDKLYSPSTLEKVAKEFHSDVSVLSGRIQYDFKNLNIQKRKEFFTSKWTWFLWIKNTVHHQATFYRGKLFTNKKFDSNCNVLSDYAYNLDLFKRNVNVKRIDELVAFCGLEGVSKNYNWSLYKEEINIKTRASSLFLYPVFFTLALLKYLVKKTRSK